MSDTVLLDRAREGGSTIVHTHGRLTADRTGAGGSTSSRASAVQVSGALRRKLLSLPYDILFQIVQQLDVGDVIQLTMTCTTLRDLDKARPIWLRLATKMLDRCQPLPVDGFLRLLDLSTPELARTVKRGFRGQTSWQTRRPRLTVPYKSFSAPGDEDIVWLSPVTSHYALLCTKSGKVLCWDTERGKCVAEWYSGDDWEIWKCRVEFDERAAYLAMARRVHSGTGTDCQLMSLNFPPEPINEERTDEKPEFRKLSSFNLPGHVISVFLLDPPKKILTAYIWIERSNTLGLYVLLDWSVPLYVFVDTGIIYDHRKEWSCIGYDPENVVIHAEDKDFAEQYYYPIASLHERASPFPPPASTPRLMPPSNATELKVKGDARFANYWSYSAHFVRQWWPTLPYEDRIRRRSCTIVLLARPLPPPQEGDQYQDGTHQFTIAQHYFSIPLYEEQLRWWYVRQPFEIVCYPHVTTPAGGIAPAFEADVQEEVAGEAGEAGGEGGEGGEGGGADGAGEDAVEAGGAADLPPNTHIVPLIAVDFGCVVWIEYTKFGGEDKRLRFVSFPTVDVDRDDASFSELDSHVRTLETPREIDLSQVCHIGVDQAQASVILGITTGKVFMIRYE